LEYLDISLNSWSLIIFFIQVLLSISMSLAVFNGGRSRGILIFIFMFFIINQTTLVLYGISTGQVGFVLIVIFQLFLIMLSYIYINSTLVEWEEDYEDR
jgi:hypothetical protein